MSISSVSKTLKYLECVSSAETTITFDGEVMNFPKQKALRLCKTFWHKDYCNCCGQCCRNYNIVYSKNEFEQVKKAELVLGNLSVTNLAERKKLTVGSNSYIYYEVPAMTKNEGHDLWVNSHTVRNCRFAYLESDGVTKHCMIHNYRPITCGFPHMEFHRPRVEGGIPTLHHIQFGRNHMLQCNVDLSLPYDEETYLSDLRWLHKLDDFGNEYNIPTFLPKVIQYIESVDWKNPPTQDIMIHNGTRSLL